jgi:hypothetical protein
MGLATEGVIRQERVEAPDERMEVPGEIRREARAGHGVERQLIRALLGELGGPSDERRHGQRHEQQ